jgi:cyclic pyranopterin phosphate synthase
MAGCCQDAASHQYRRAENHRASRERPASRLTADGMWYLCLYAAGGLDLRALVRSGATREQMLDTISKHWQARSDRGAEDRLALGDRRAFVPITSLKSDPHLEMHTRGG